MGEHGKIPSTSHRAGHGHRRLCRAGQGRWDGCWGFLVTSLPPSSVQTVSQRNDRDRAATHTPHMCTPHTQQENEVRTNTFTLGKQLHQLPSHHRTPQITDSQRKACGLRVCGDLVTSAAMHLLGMLRTGVQSREHSLTSQALTALTGSARPLALLP